MTIYDELMAKGYYVGQSTEIFSSDELLKIRYSVETDIKDCFTNNTTINDWTYFITCIWPDHDVNKNKAVPYDQVQERLELIAKQNVYVQQSWFSKFYSALKKPIISNSYLNEKQQNFISKIYNTGNGKISGPTNITYYRENDFISVHQDGKNINRICGLLIYLTPPENYNSTYGGRLLLQPATQYTNANPEDYHLLPVQVEPVSPNMIVFDFSKHNVYHAVEKCKTNFNRTALLTFFTLE